jgi:hypothetical protein
LNAFFILSTLRGKSLSIFRALNLGLQRTFGDVVADILTGGRVSRVVVVLFLKIFLRLSDHMMLSEWMEDDESLDIFMQDMWELAEEYDDDELTEWLTVVFERRYCDNIRDS